MKSREFCYWLQGFFELQPKPLMGGSAGYGSGGGNPQLGLTPEQTELIRRHLQLVFKHEIDPSYTNRAELDAIHGGGTGGGSSATFTPKFDNETLTRC